MKTKVAVAAVIITARIIYMRKHPPSPEEMQNLIEQLKWIL